MTSNNKYDHSEILYRNLFSEGIGDNRKYKFAYSDLQVYGKL